MKCSVPVTMAITAFTQGAFAIVAAVATVTPVTSLSGHKVCAHPTATITRPAMFMCDIACMPPTSVCKKGESTGPPQTSTYTSDCTEIKSGLGCPGCASCHASVPTRVTSLSSHKVCAHPTATITQPPLFMCDVACMSPTSVCKKGEPTGPPQTTTYTSDCTKIQSGLGCPGCASCHSTPTPVTTVSSHKVCAHPTATITRPAQIICDIACMSPTSVCKQGEPTGPPRSTTYTSDCTVIKSGYGCPGCASCQDKSHPKTA